MISTSALVALILLAIATPAYIHPDEWLQSWDPIYGRLLAVQTRAAWEWASAIGNDGGGARSVLPALVAVLIVPWISSNFMPVRFLLRAWLFVWQRALMGGLLRISDQGGAVLRSVPFCRPL